MSRPLMASYDGTTAQTHSSFTGHFTAPAASADLLAELW